MENKFDKFSYEEREILGILLNNEGVPCWNKAKEIIKNLYDELNEISKKNDEQEKVGLFLKDFKEAELWIMY